MGRNNRRKRRQKGGNDMAIAKAQDKFLRQLSLLNSNIDPKILAMKPNESHAWVYVAAQCIALNLASVPFVIQTETDEAQGKRRAVAKRSGRNWKAGRGFLRTAMDRHGKNKQRLSGMKHASLEPDHDHPLAQLLRRPNPHMSQFQLMQITGLLIALKGGAAWLRLGENGDRVGPGGETKELWPVSYDSLSPIHKDGQQVGWALTLPKGFGGSTGSVTIPIFMHELIEFKFPDPESPSMPISPLTAAAAGISLDMSVMQLNQQILNNGGQPSGVLATDNKLQLPAIEELQSVWQESYQGTWNAGRIPIMHSGLKWINTSINNKDMQYMEGRRWNRDEILAIMGVPKASVGVTDDLNYATQVAQDRNLWTKRLLPIMRLIEDEIDHSLLFTQPDTVFGIFDITGVDALRVGLQEKVKIALGLSSPTLHVPPKLAFETAGIDMPEYEGNDVAGTPKPESATPATVENAMAIKGANSIARIKEAKTIWHEHMQTHEAVERRLARDWRKWVSDEETKALAHFDSIIDSLSKAAGTHLLRAAPVVKIDPPVDISGLLLPIEDSQKSLRKVMRGSLFQGAQDVFTMTAQEIDGLVVFGFDDPTISQVIEDVQERVVGTTPVTIQNNLRKSLTTGITNGETFNELRDRISEVYGGAASPSKTLMVARTETGALFNGIRNGMFDLAGLDEREWITAGDEVVRHDHSVFGSAGPKDSSFDYLTLAQNSTGGSLRYPHDPNGPPGQVINCRCTQVPVMPEIEEE